MPLIPLENQHISAQRGTSLKSLPISSIIGHLHGMCMDRANSFIYILCNRHRNVLYVGATDDLRKRVYFHKKRLIAGFTRKYNVDQLVYFEAYDNIKAALARERQLKGYRREKKILLIQQKNPMWEDLYERLGR
jgi:putative endonuclease